MASRGGRPESGTSGLEEAVRFQRDLYLYWREVRAAGGLALTTRGYLARPALRRLRAALTAADGTPAPQTDLGESEDTRLLFIRRLLERLTLLRAAETRLVAEDRAAMAGFLALPLGERLRTCARVWVAGGWWPDRVDPRLAPPRLMLPAPPRVALARRRLLDTLMAGAPGAPVVTLATAGGAASAPRRAAKGRRASSRVESITPEADIQRAALAGSLAWMGFVAVTDGADGAAVSFRTTPAARALRADAPALDEAHGRVRLLPDFTIVAFPPLTAPELLVLDTCAELTSLDQTARYRLTRQAFGGARAAGWSAQTTAERLEALAGAPVPANVRVTLNDWERHGERLRLTRDVRLLEVPAPALLDALLAEASAERWVERRLTATAALLAPEGVAPVRAWLLQRGALPALVRATEPE